MESKSSRNVFDMSDLFSSLPDEKKSSPKGSNKRSPKEKLAATSKVTRKSTRARKSAKRYSPGKTMKKPRTSAQKAAVLKAKKTRELNKRLGFKTTAARRSAAAKKAQTTRKRFNMSDIMSALEGI
jgi:hypothetical protein